MRVLLFESTAHYPSSPLFLEAMQELTGQRPGELHYTFVDEARFARPRGLAARLARRLLGRYAVDRRALNQAVLLEARSFRPDLCLIDKGAHILPRTLVRIKQDTGALLVNYATDDPFNPLVSTREVVDSISLYDIYACTKRAIMTDVARAGCARVIYLPFAYKPSVHFPEPPAVLGDHQRFDSDVAFIGGCDRDRSPLLKALVKAIPELKLALYGGFWNRSPALRRYWRGFAMGREFRLALGGCKIALNLVRRANRDGHVMRSFEIPACGAFMLTERTAEHLALFGEAHEVGYFEDPQDLVAAVRRYLGNRDERRRMARAAHDLVTRGPHTYRHRLAQILRLAGAARSAAAAAVPDRA